MESKIAYYNLKGFEAFTFLYSKAMEVKPINCCVIKYLTCKCDLVLYDVHYLNFIYKQICLL